MHLLVSNDCPYVPLSSYKYLVRWYAKSHTKVTFLCPHLDPDTSLGKSQIKYIDKAMKLAPDVSYTIETKVSDGNFADTYGEPNIIVMMYYGPSPLYNPYKEGIESTLGLKIHCEFQTKDRKANKTAPRLYHQAVNRGETKESIALLGTQYLEYSHRFMINPKAYYDYTRERMTDANCN